ncbi:MAG TPA: tetratricopeptide repeat protein [Verrucomicrobiae bacterium]|nr:tetratricopeptide repeat protein [Verrucomicrobiae bacterium]
MRRYAVPMLLAPVLLAGCASTPKQGGTLAELHHVEPDLKDATVDQGLDQAMQAYRKFLEETPVSAMTPEAMRRLADLQVEKQFGIRPGAGLPQPVAFPLAAETPATTSANAPVAAGPAAPHENQLDFEKRATTGSAWPASGDADASIPGLPGGADPKGPLEAIALYEKLLQEYPEYQNSDQVLYQMARAYDEVGKTEKAMSIMDRLIAANPTSPHMDEVQFRRGEYFFTRRKFRDAENAYAAVTKLGAGSPFHELALYKLGWTFYKQDLYEEALQQYMALIDSKVAAGYDFDQKHEEDDERRVADTFRVISLSFSNLGGPDAIRDYFGKAGERPYEDRVYTNLGDHYLEKLRYDDAAKTFNAFVALHPFHRQAPAFSMRVVDTFTKGGFPKLVLESKRDFASHYGVKAEYWQHNKIEESPDVVAYLKTDLKDLATHYHAQYQGAKKDDEKQAHYQEARRWYGDYLASFPTDAETPGMNYRLADLFLENKDFAQAALQYEHTAYEYPAHEKSSAAGYAAVFAHREQLKAADDKDKETIRRQTVASSLKFADTFPDHEHAAAILGAAADDLYEMKDYPAAVDVAGRLLEKWPGAEPDLKRTAWTVVAHGSFELARYPQAENAYTQVLAATPADDDGRAALVDNLAASIYKQGEQARDAEDFKTAAGHFARIRTAAPTSAIRPAAEYDAGTALLSLKDWTGAATALETFRTDFPGHKLQVEATRQIALAYKESGQLARAAGEYENLASQSEDPKVKGDSLLLAGDLYVQSRTSDKALEAYGRYVKEFPHPLEAALDTRSKMAEIHKTANEDGLYRKQLEEIVHLDAGAGKERTARTRTIAGRSALVLSEDSYTRFTAVKLTQPFEKSLAEKKKRMDAVIDTMDALVDYEISDVTAAATFYMAETYYDFSRSLTDSERPADLPADRVAEYESALDEEAYPFEEKAIDFHEKNLEMMRQGSVSSWTEKSLARLAELVPGRYAKKEASSGPLKSIDSYTYRTPLSLMPPPPPPPAPDGMPTPGKPAKDAAPAKEGADSPANDAPAKDPAAADKPAEPAKPPAHSPAPAKTPKPKGGR